MLFPPPSLHHSSTNTRPPASVHPPSFINQHMCSSSVLPPSTINQHTCSSLRPLSILHQPTHVLLPPSSLHSPSTSTHAPPLHSPSILHLHLPPSNLLTWISYSWFFVSVFPPSAPSFQTATLPHRHPTGSNTTPPAPQLTRSSSAHPSVQHTSPERAPPSPHRTFHNPHPIHLSTTQLLRPRFNVIEAWNDMNKIQLKLFSFFFLQIFPSIPDCRFQVLFASPPSRTPFIYHFSYIAHSLPNVSTSILPPLMLLHSLISNPPCQ